MLTRVEALNFRCLRYISRSLDPFHVLVGPNASGKTTFFDVVGFVSRLLNDGLEAAIEEGFPSDSFNPSDLLFNKQGDGFELALEVVTPKPTTRDTVQKHFRYELSVGVNTETQPFIRAERLAILSDEERSQIEEWPPLTLMRGKGRTIVNASYTEPLISYYPDAEPNEVAEHFPFNRSHSTSALPTFRFLDGEIFPGGVWFEALISQGVQRVDLVSRELRKPSPRNRSRLLRADGSNLPWIVKRIEDTPAYDDWIAHLQTATPEVQGVRTIQREEDGFRYLKVKYANGLDVPQWMVSDGTLRLIALTLLAFLPTTPGIILIEEPENGIHPRAIETVFQALSTVSSAQILLATHSPSILSCAELSQVLCFAKDEFGATSIVSGDEHPALQQWKHDVRDVSLGTLFAAGAL